MVARNEIEEKIRAYHVALSKSWRNRLECEGHHRMSTAVVESRNSGVTRV